MGVARSAQKIRIVPVDNARYSCKEDPDELSCDANHNQKEADIEKVLIHSEIYNSSCLGCWLRESSNRVAELKPVTSGRSDQLV